MKRIYFILIITIFIIIYAHKNEALLDPPYELTVYPIPETVNEELKIMEYELPDTEVLIPIIEEVSIYKSIIENLTEEEKELLYKVTYAEAGNQSMEGQRAVIEVILNRVISDKFPNSIEKVLSQSGQFTTWSYLHKTEYNDTQIQALEEVYNSVETILDFELLYVYFSRGKANYMKNSIKIEDHWFGSN